MIWPPDIDSRWREPHYFISRLKVLSWVSPWYVGSPRREFRTREIEDFLSEYPDDAYDIRYVQQNGDFREYHLRILDDDVRFHFRMRFI